MSINSEAISNNLQRGRKPFTSTILSASGKTTGNSSANRIENSDPPPRRSVWVSFSTWKWFLRSGRTGRASSFPTESISVRAKILRGTFSLILSRREGNKGQPTKIKGIRPAILRERSTRPLNHKPALFRSEPEATEVLVSTKVPLCRKLILSLCPTKPIKINRLYLFKKYTPGTNIYGWWIKLTRLNF